MRKNTFFKVLTYILLPISAFTGCLAIMGIMGAASGNVSQLFNTFVCACMTMYVMCTTRFLFRGIAGGIHCGPVLLQLMRANSVVSLYLCYKIFANAYGFANMPYEQMKVLMHQMLEAQPSAKDTINPHMVRAMLGFVASIMSFFGLAIVVHIIMNFRLQKIYAYLFAPASEE